MFSLMNSCYEKQAVASSENSTSTSKLQVKRGTSLGTIALAVNNDNSGQKKKKDSAPSSATCFEPGDRVLVEHPSFVVPTLTTAKVFQDAVEEFFTKQDTKPSFGLFDSMLNVAKKCRVNNLGSSHMEAVAAAEWLLTSDADDSTVLAASAAVCKEDKKNTKQSTATGGCGGASPLKSLLDDLYTPVGDVTEVTADELKTATSLLRLQSTSSCSLDPISFGGKQCSSTNGVWNTLFEESTTAGSNTDDAATQMIRFLHAVRVNTHSDNKRGFNGVFPTASKFTHSCNPNTFWVLHELNPLEDLLTSKDKKKCGDDSSSSEDEDEGEVDLRDVILQFLKKTAATKPKASPKELLDALIDRVFFKRYVVVHVALRKIEFGETLTFGYQGTGLNNMCHTLQRRQSLHELNFVCKCDRCRTFDDGNELIRPLSCAVCFQKNPRETEGKFCYLLPRQHGGWYCTTCKETLPGPAVAAAIKKEQQIIDMMMGLFFQGNGGASSSSTEDTNKLKRLISSTEMGQYCASAGDGLSVRWTLAYDWMPRQLGLKHYGTIVAGHSMVRCLIIALIQLQREGSSDFIPFLWRQQQQFENAGKLQPHTGKKKGASFAAPTSTKVNGCWLAVLFQNIVQAHKWFQDELAHSSQHIKYIAMCIELVVLLSDENVFERLIVSRLERVVRSDPNARCGRTSCRSSTVEDDVDGATSVSFRAVQNEPESSRNQRRSQYMQQLKLLHAFSARVFPIVEPFWIGKGREKQQGAAGTGLAEFAPMSMSVGRLVDAFQIIVGSSK